MNITDKQSLYIEESTKSLQNQGFRVESDLRNEKIGFKIRDWTLKRVPYILVAGDREREAGELAVRTRDGKDLGSHSLESVVAALKVENQTRGKTSLSQSLEVAESSGA